MPTLPLYDTDAAPDAWHQVIAPGGYEWWHFAATSRSNDLRIQFDIFDGNPFSREYQRAYARYRRRPTRIAPPVPRDFPYARLMISSNYSEATGEPGTFDGTHPFAIRLGPASMNILRESNSIRLAWSEMVELNFRPAGLENPKTSRFESEQTSSVHFWNIGGTDYHVTGRGSRRPVRRTRAS